VRHHRDAEASNTILLTTRHKLKIFLKSGQRPADSILSGRIARMGEVNHSAKVTRHGTDVEFINNTSKHTKEG